MKNIKFYIIGLSVALSLSSCSLFDDYLDVIPKGELVLKNTQEYADMLNWESYTAYIMSNSLAGLSDDEWTNPEFYLQSTALSYPKINYLYMDNFTLYNRQDYIAPSTGPYPSYYGAIGQYNIILKYIDESTGDEALKLKTKAEAKFLSAFRHFYLVNIYAKNYNPATAATDLAVPIRDEFDVEKTMTQATVAEVYAFIERRLGEAIPDLSNTPVNPYHPSKAAGWALKAKVHFQKGEYKEAKEAALESYRLNSQLFDLVAFCKNTTKPVINAVQPENLLFGYVENIARPSISPSLKQLFEKEPDDCRYDPFFFKQDEVKPGNKDDNAYTSRYQLQSTQFAMNVAGLRTSEVMLILAECYAREGNPQESMKYINQLREKRITDYNNKIKPNPTTEEAAMQIVLEERRKELLFGFHRILDIRRLSNDSKYMITPTRFYPADPNSAYGPQKEYKLSPNSYLLTAPISWIILEQDTYLKNNTPEVYIKR